MSCTKFLVEVALPFIAPLVLGIFTSVFTSFIVVRFLEFGRLRSGAILEFVTIGPKLIESAADGNSVKTLLIAQQFLTLPCIELANEHQPKAAAELGDIATATRTLFYECAKAIDYSDSTSGERAMAMNAQIELIKPRANALLIQASQIEPDSKKFFTVAINHMFYLFGVIPPGEKGNEPNAERDEVR